MFLKIKKLFTICQRRIIPEQPVNTEETQSLVENDWLLKENSQNQELSQTNSVDEQKIE